MSRKKKQTDSNIEKKLKELRDKWQETDGTVIELVTEKYSDVKAEVIEWLWENKIPKEGITMFVGDPETFKSTTSLYVAAQVSQGRCFPKCDSPTKRGLVLIMASEDSHSVVVKPRLMAADADLDKIEHIVSKKVTDVFKRKAKESYITDLIAEIDLLEEKIKSIPDFRLLIIDTLSSYLGARKINSMEDTKSFLDRLSDLCYKYHFATIVIHHFNKNEEASAQYRSAGSVGIRGAARAQWGFVLDQKNKERGFMLRDKLNISSVRTGLAFHMNEVELNLNGKPTWVGCCVFEDEVINEDLQTFLSRGQKKQWSKKDDAVEWLKDYLKNGCEHKTNNVIAAAKEHGIAEKTLRRAKKKAKIQVKAIKNPKTKEINHWTWQLI